jgi:CheY-like chemotaxis protein
MSKLCTILVVDDEEAMRKIIPALLKEGLKKRTVVVSAAENGSDALRIIRSFQFNMIISDYSMPKMNGLELLANVREIAPATRFHLVSGNDRNDIDRKIMEMSPEKRPDGFLEKPFSLFDLKREVKKILKGEKSEKQMD